MLPVRSIVLHGTGRSKSVDIGAIVNASRSLPGLDPLSQSALLPDAPFLEIEGILQETPYLVRYHGNASGSKDLIKTYEARIRSLPASGDLNPARVLALRMMKRILDEAPDEGVYLHFGVTLRQPAATTLDANPSVLTAIDEFFRIIPHGDNFPWHIEVRFHPVKRPSQKEPAKETSKLPPGVDFRFPDKGDVFVRLQAEENQTRVTLSRNDVHLMPSAAVQMAIEMAESWEGLK